MIKTAYTRRRQNTVKNVMDRPLVQTKTAYFLPADFEQETLTGTSYGTFLCYQIVKKIAPNLLPLNFLLFSNCASIVLTLAQILLPSHLSSFSKCASIV